MSDFLVYLGVRISEAIGNIDVIAIGQGVANMAAATVDSIQWEIEHYNAYYQKNAELEMKAAQELEEEPQILNFDHIPQNERSDKEAKKR